MPANIEVVITGVGVASPLGIGHAALWSAMIEGRSGIDFIRSFDASGLPVRVAGEVRDFDPKQLVRPRKSLKVMSRDIQLGVAAADLAMADAGLADGAVDPDRFGVVYGADPIHADVEEASLGYRACIEQGRFRFEHWAERAMPEAAPLGMLKLLPNMTACHVSIIHDARAHNNTIYQGELSSLLALSEAARVIQRGAADCMLVGATSSRMNPLDWVRSCVYEELAREFDDPATSCRPFDARRRGMVRSEGGAVLVMESRLHAESRGANILARLASTASSSEPVLNGRHAAGDGLRRAIRLALATAGMSPADLGHVNAHGDATRAGDALEARVLAEVVGDVPVTAPKSAFGNLYAAGGMIEAAVSVLAVAHGEVPHTQNFEPPNHECAIRVVHGEPLRGALPAALLVNRTPQGQAAAAVIVAPD